MDIKAQLQMNKHPDPQVSVSLELSALEATIAQMDTELDELAHQLGPVQFPPGPPTTERAVPSAVVTMPPMAEQVRMLRFRLEGMFDRLVDARMRISI